MSTSARLLRGSSSGHGGADDVRVDLGLFSTNQRASQPDKQCSVLGGQSLQKWRSKHNPSLRLAPVPAWLSGWTRYVQSESVCPAVLQSAPLRLVEVWRSLVVGVCGCGCHASQVSHLAVGWAALGVGRWASSWANFLSVTQATLQLLLDLSLLSQTDSHMLKTIIMQRHCRFST
jgi:hypothetical protein